MSTTTEKNTPQTILDTLRGTNGTGKKEIPAKSRPKKSNLWMVIALTIGGIIAAGAIVLIIRQFFGGVDQQLIYYTVKPGDLPITVTESGIIESQENVKVLCEINDLPDDGLRGTPIRWIIPNGSTVKKGQLIVEFEFERYIERRDRQVITLEKARADKIEAEKKFETQDIQNKTLLANTKLEVLLADLEKKMYEDKNIGTYKLEADEINRKIDDINTKIIAAKAKLELAKKDLYANESLFKLGYAGKTELDKSRLDVLQAESEFATKVNELSTQLAALKKKEKYEYEMQLETLKGKLATAKRKVTQVEKDNEALLAQAKAKKVAAEEAFKKEEELLKRYEMQVKNCKIYAPRSGMVAYAAPGGRRWWLSEIRQGQPVSRKQHILSIPNLEKMQVKTTVHESVIDQIRAGLTATVRVEAFPDDHFAGKVTSVDVLAKNQSSEARVYETIVKITGNVNQLKPGMTAVVKIHIKRLKNVLTVPVQAVMQIQKDSWCYVDNGSGIERRMVQLGLTNHKFVEVREGLKEGDRIVLNPMALINNMDDENSSISPEEQSPSKSKIKSELFNTSQ